MTPRSDDRCRRGGRPFSLSPMSRAAPSQTTSIPLEPRPDSLRESGHVLTEHAILLAALLTLGGLASFPFAKDLLAGLRSHLEWVFWVVEAPLP